MNENNFETDFIDEFGQHSTIKIKSNDNKNIKLGTKPYKLQTPYDNQYKNIKKKGIFTSDIGIKSSGFAPIFTLALIITFGGILIAYLLWRF